VLEQHTIRSLTHTRRAVPACSVERWEISYDRNLHTREVQAAVQDMNSWRVQLLSLVD